MSIYDFKVKKINGEEISLEEFKGKVLLIVNTASSCGFTPQLEGLQRLYENYHEKGLEILGFPCNQFNSQDKGTNDEIHTFCKSNYGVTFNMFEKIEVNGENENPLYSFLKDQQKGVLGTKIKWNFTKFLVDREGNVVSRFAPNTKPENFEEKIVDLL